MFSWRPPVVAAAMILGLLACGYLAISTFVKWQLEKPVIHTVNDPTDANTTWRSVQPLSHAEAVKAGRCPIPLPQDAAEIQYVDFCGYGGFSRCVRFEAPVETCRAHAATVLTAFNQHLKAEHIDAGAVVSPIPFNKSTAESVAGFIREQEHKAARVDWFDADSILHGEMWGDHDSHMPLILIDTDRGVFYYFISD